MKKDYAPYIISDSPLIYPWEQIFGTLSIGDISLFGKNIGGFYAPYVGKCYCDCDFSLLKNTAGLFLALGATHSPSTSS